jgi:hypothetical protein
MLPEACARKEKDLCPRAPKLQKIFFINNAQNFHHHLALRSRSDQPFFPTPSKTTSIMSALIAMQQR